MTPSPTRRRSLAAALIAGLMLVGLVVAPGAQARTVRHHYQPGLGTTTVTTAPGVAGTLLGAGIVPLPVAPTSFRLSVLGGLAVSYGFPITGSTADLATGTGDITHSGGINFVGLSGKLEIGKFDVDLAAKKIYATEVNFRAARIPVLDLDLSGVVVTPGRGVTVVSGIVVTLDPAAAEALNTTFGVGLPTDGSLVFGKAVIRING